MSRAATTEFLTVLRNESGLPSDRILTAAEDLLVYECDGYIIERNLPDAVVFPETTEEVAAVVRLCHRFQVPFLPRGAGTSLAGGCLPVGGGVVLSLARMNQILEIHAEDGYAVVEPGVVNIRLQQAIRDLGLQFAPDPSSQGACTIGGNVAANAGGPHTLKYGVTVNHVLGLEFVTPDGDVVRVGGPHGPTEPGDLTALLVGSEGTFGVITRVWVRLIPVASQVRTVLAIFDSVRDATNTISDIIGRGIIPAALELLDQGILVAVEEAFRFGFPLDAGAVLIIETDGDTASVQADVDAIRAVCGDQGARELRYAETSDERALLWKARKKAFGAIGRLSPSFCTQDGVVPRTRLPEILDAIEAASARHNIRIVNVFHAGDGNIHPILLFDERDSDQTQRVLNASEEILQACLRLGGSVTGEHGIGVEKINLMESMFSSDDLDVMNRVRLTFNPTGLCSPGKLLPTSGACSGEIVTQRHPGRRAAL